MSGPPTELYHPPARALSSARGVRRQLVRLFQEGKASLLEPTLLGRLTHCLNTIQAIDRSVLLEERLAAIEVKLKIKPRANGHTRHVDEIPSEVRPS